MGKGSMNLLAKDMMINNDNNMYLEEWVCVYGRESLDIISHHLKYEHFKHINRLVWVWHSCFGGRGFVLSTQFKPLKGEKEVKVNITNSVK